MLVASRNDLASLKKSGDLIAGNSSMRHFTLSRENLSYDGTPRDDSSASGCDLELAQAWRSHELPLRQRRVPTLGSVQEFDDEDDFGGKSFSKKAPLVDKVPVRKDINQLCEDFLSALAANQDDLVKLPGDSLLDRIRSVLDSVRDLSRTGDKETLSFYHEALSESSSYSSASVEKDLDLEQPPAKEKMVLPAKTKKVSKSRSYRAYERVEI